VVGKDNRVTVRPVTITRDEGATVLISGAIRPGDKVIDSPPDSIQSGDKVSVASGGKGTAHAG
jgi:hypothetical protein